MALNSGAVEHVIGLSRTVWENGQPVLEDLEWIRQPDGTWTDCDGRGGLSRDAVLEALCSAIHLADRSVAEQKDFTRLG